MIKCSKCKSSCEGGSTYIEGGETYSFCKECTDILETFPIPKNILHTFLGTEKMQSLITKNIFEARKRRVKGEKVWN
jgi:hypothetical protein